MIIPEIALFTYLKSLQKMVLDDLAANVATPTKTILYGIFGTTQIGNYNYFTQAKELFSRTANHPRSVDIRLFFDRDRAKIPTIHLSLPSESEDNSFLGGYNGEIVTDVVDGSYTQTMAQIYTASYNVIFTSDNTFEVLLMYHVFKALIKGSTEALQCVGLFNPHLSGADLQIYSELVTEQIFIRGLTVKASYSAETPELNKRNLIEEFKICEVLVSL